MLLILSAFAHSPQEIGTGPWRVFDPSYPLRLQVQRRRHHRRINLESIAYQGRAPPTASTQVKLTADLAASVPQWKHWDGCTRFEFVDDTVQPTHVLEDGVCVRHLSPLDETLEPHLGSAGKRFQAYANQLGILLREDGPLPTTEGATLRQVLQKAQREGFSYSYQLLRDQRGRWRLLFPPITPDHHPADLQRRRALLQRDP